MKFHKLPIVYMIYTPDFEFIKIGLSKNIKSRMRNIQSGCPFLLTLHTAATFLSYKNAAAYEKKMHRRLEEFRVRGEWYSLEVSIIDDIEDEFRGINKANRGEFNALL